MQISDLITDLGDFIAAHGDTEIEAEYWCTDCGDTHEGKGFQLELVNGKLRLSVKHLGE